MLKLAVSDRNMEENAVLDAAALTVSVGGATVARSGTAAAAVSPASLLASLSCSAKATSGGASSDADEDAAVDAPGFGADAGPTVAAGTIDFLLDDVPPMLPLQREAHPALVLPVVAAGTAAAAADAVLASAAASPS